MHIKQRDRCTHLLDNNSGGGNGKYVLIIPANPAIGILYITKDSPGFISGHVRMRGKDNGQYPFKYLKMLENLFCYEPNTIEVCSNGVTTTAKDDGCCFTVDINPATKPTMVCNALSSLQQSKYRKTNNSIFNCLTIRNILKNGR